MAPFQQWSSCVASIVQCMKEKDRAGLLHPRDRNGKVLHDRYASPGLEDALEEFRATCAAAAVAVRERLRQLASQLQVGRLRVRNTFTSLPMFDCAAAVAVRERLRQLASQLQVGFMQFQVLWHPPSVAASDGGLRRRHRCAGAAAATAS